MYVKVCGLRTARDVDAAVAAGADAIGFVFSASVRKIGVEEARGLAERIPESVLTVAVVNGIAAVDAARMALEAGLDAVQLHGDYPRAEFDAIADSPLRRIRATTLSPETDVRVGAFGEDLLLLDGVVPGSGDRWDLAALDAVKPEGHWLLAGGLTPDNVAEAIAAAAPWGVDVSSGVESERGVKDPGLIRAFISAARA
ncbi:phosphoribosylanthranilate isomerase [Actinokineospora sp. HUAS TT18]|uniref:phosphoribosylanthranilate isomerase n=1 Tax=Actinokineospora sp. HUAS TT18 TaxID=3447451 RepID=UPI003F521033